MRLISLKPFKVIIKVLLNLSNASSTTHPHVEAQGDAENLPGRSRVIQNVCDYQNSFTLIVVSKYLKSSVFHNKSYLNYISFLQVQHSGTQFRLSLTWHGGWHPSKNFIKRNQGWMIHFWLGLDHGIPQWNRQTWSSQKPSNKEFNMIMVNLLYYITS